MKYTLITSLAFCAFCASVFVTSLEAGKVKGHAAAMNNGECSLTSGRTIIRIDPAVGARIISLKLGGYEFLTGSDIMPGNYGSTFWPSPQSAWNWPPPAVLDNEPYSSEIRGDTLEFFSAEDQRTGLRVSKEFFPGRDGRINIVYSMTNVTNSFLKAAPWEITRVHKGGILFFPVGNNPLGKKTFEQAPASIVDGIAWYRDSLKRPSENLLTTAIGTAGWAAYAIDGKLFVKKFPDVGKDEVAPGEGEISFYVSKEADYVEFEIQGEYRALFPGERTSWHVEWIAADIPTDVRAKIGSKSLVEFARRLVE